MDWADWSGGSGLDSGDYGDWNTDYTSYEMPMYESYGQTYQEPFVQQATQALEQLGPQQPSGFGSPYPQLGPGGFMPQQQSQQPIQQQQQQMSNPWAAAIGGAIPGLLGLLGNVAGGQTATRSQQLPVAQRAAYNQGNQMLGQYGPAFAAGQMPLQQMQMNLLKALESGQGLAPNYQGLIEQAYQPVLGDLYSQATEQGRRRGFYDAPAQSPAGSAILGPGLAALQGQQAASKLGLMQSLPGLFNTPIQQQGNFAQQFGQGLMNQPGYAWNQTATPAMGPVLGQSLQQAAGGAGQGYGIADIYNQMLTQRMGGGQQQPPQQNYNFAPQYGLSYT